MPSFHSKNAGKEAVSPSSYEIYSVNLYNIDNINYVDIKDLISSIVIKESIFASSIEIDIRLIDAVNLFELNQIIGGEKVKLKLFRVIDPSDKFAESKHKFDITVNVASVIDHNKKEIGTQLYTLRCYSNHAFINSIKTINRSFSGVPDALVSDICQKDLAYNNLVPFTNKNTNEMKGIYPNLKPLEAINWILRNSSGENNTPLFFYETIQTGLQLNSYFELLDQEVYIEYNDKAFIDAPKDTNTYDQAATKIRKMSSSLDMSIYNMIKNGVFSSSALTLDIATKKFENIPFEFDGKSSLNKHKPFASILEFDNTTLIDSNQSKEFYINENTKAFGDINNYHNSLRLELNNKQSALNALKFMSLNLLVSGDFNLTCGNLVELKISKTGDSTELRNKDKAFSGKYLVTSVVHTFDQEEYRCNIIIQKDSVQYDVDTNPNISNEEDNKILTNG